MRTLVISTALAVATAGLATVAGPAHAGVPWLVTVKADATQVTLGRTVSFSGKVTPVGGAAGLKVVLQEKAGPGKPWRTQRTAKVGAAGRYHLSDKPTVNTVRQYRVVMPATPAHVRGVSPAVRVKVYGWSKLSDHAPVNENGLNFQSSVNLDGVAYPNSIRAFWADPTSVEFNVDHLCVALKGTFGIDDDSETGAQATVSAFADGTQVYTHTFAVGEKAVQRIALDSPLKLKLSALSMVPDVHGFGAVGTPQILCTR
jgi:hypothetical protein